MYVRMSEKYLVIECSQRTTIKDKSDVIKILTVYFCVCPSMLYTTYDTHVNKKFYLFQHLHLKLIYISWKLMGSMVLTFLIV